MPKKINLDGLKFGRLKVISINDKRDNHGNIYWNCLCDCGIKTIKSSKLLRAGQTKSCGCLFIETAIKKGKARKTHGMTESKTYTTWVGMKDRCYNKNNKKYNSYGGRGIIVCERWLESFENFYADMGVKPNDKNSIDRINNNGNYEPANCKWSTYIEQANNRRDNVIIYGMTLNQYCLKNNLNADKVQQRLKRGYSIEKSVST